MKHVYIVLSKRLKNAVAMVVTAVIAIGLPVKLSAQAPSINYKTPQTFNISTPITQLAPTNSGGAVAAVGYSSPITYGSDDNSQMGVAADAAGNLYVSDYNLNEVYKIAAGGGSTTILTSSIFGPSSVALDAAGNIYVTGGHGQVVPNGGGPDTIYKIPAGGGSPVVVRAGFGNMVDITVDFAGNIYVNDNNIIKKIPAGGGPIVIIGTNTFYIPQGFAVDAAGDLYVTDNPNGVGKIWKVPVGGGQIQTFASGLPYVLAVTVDATGNVFCIDGSYDGVTFISGIYKIPPGGGSPVTVTQISSTGGGFNRFELAIDGAGNFYAPDGATPAAIKKIKRIGGYYINPGLPAGLSFDASTGIISGTPTVSSPATNYTVTAYNSSGSSQAIVNIKVVPAVSASLSGLTISSGTLTPSFNSATTNYTAIVTNSVSSVTLTPTTEVNTSTVKVNGVAVASGSASGAIALKVGTNTINTLVTAQGGTPTATYTVVVTRAAPPNLASLKLSNGTLSPAFASGTTSYAASVGNGAASITVTPATVDQYSTVKVNGATVESGSPSGSVMLTVGHNTISVVVTSLDGTLSNTYTVVVTRAASSNANLSALHLSSGSLSPSFSPGTTVYTSSVTSNTASITVTPTTAVTGATVTVNGTAVASGTPSGAIALTIGSNAITINVMAPDGNTVAIYFLSVTRQTSSNDNLAGLAVSNGTLNPVFSGSTTSYTATLANGTTAVTVTPTTSDASATVTVNGTPITSGSASAAIPLNEGSNTIATKVTASDGSSTKTYTITINIPVTADARLSGLEISSGTLKPTFSDDVVYYTDSVANSVASVMLTPTADDPGATILVDGYNVTSGSASTALNLLVGNNTLTTKVIAKDGFTTVTYIIIVTRAPSSDPNLSNLAIAPGTLKPVFASGITDYTDMVSNAITSVVITPTAEDPNATITVNGNPVISGFTSPSINLVVGDNPIPIVVTPPDKSTPKQYTITVTKAGSNNAFLADLKISSGTLTPAFAIGTIKYTASVSNTTASITVTPSTADANATVTVNGTTVVSGKASGSIPLNVGPNIITTIDTAQDGKTTKTYTVTVTRLLSNNTNLSNLKINAGAIPLTPAFNYNTIAYTASVTNATTSIKVTPVTADVNATVKINGTVVKSGTASLALPLKVGLNTVNAIITAQNGTSIKVYTITVTRAPSANANLASLSISAGSLSPAFATGTTAYTATVGTASITVTPTTSDATAKATINGTAVTSGTASGAIPLVVGSNTVTIVLTAQDGTTTDAYTITVTRLSNNANLANLIINAGAVPLTPTFNYTITGYTASAPNATSTIKLTPIVSDASATLTINGTTVKSGTASAAIPLNVGTNTITTILTAQDKVSTRTYTVTVTRAAGPLKGLAVYDPPISRLALNDGVVVQQGLSPNGDGVNDYLIIDGISNYPDNRLLIMNRNGVLVYEAKGYNNITRVFDGHSNKTGAKQLPGTYFYSLDYMVKGETRHKTGFIILKY